LEDILSIRCDIEEELEVLSGSEVVTIDENLCRKDHWGNRWVEEDTIAPPRALATFL